MTLIRRLAVAAAAVAALATAALAQNASDRFTFGVYGGMNYTTESGSGIGSPAYRSGLLAAGFMTVRLTALISLQPEIQFSQEGTKFSGTHSGYSYSGDMSVEYFQFPLLLRVDPMRHAGSFGWHMVAGPHVATRIGCGVASSPNWVGGPTSCHEFGEPQSLDWGGMVGAGVDFTVFKRSLTLGTRYHTGVPNLFSPGNAKNRGFSFMLGTNF